MTDTTKLAVAKFLEVKQAGSVLAFIFGNGTRVELDTADLTETIKDQALMHGLNQKLRDSTAGFSKEADFEGAIAAITEVRNGLLAGQWNRSGGGSSGQVMADLAEAIAKMKGASVEKAMSAVEKATAEQRKAWMKNPTIAATMAKAKADRLKGAAKSATDDLDINLD